MTGIDDLFKDKDAIKRLQKAINRVSNEAFYVIRPDAPPGMIFYNKKMDLYIMRRDMVGDFERQMKQAGLTLVELEESDLSEAILPKKESDE